MKKNATAHIMVNKVILKFRLIARIRNANARAIEIIKTTEIDRKDN